MTRSRTAASLACALALAAPAAAFAQSAGDDQYQDPLAGQDGGGSGDSGGSTGGSGGSGGATPAPATGDTAPAQPAATTPGASTSAEAADELPRTGGEPLPLVAIGAALLITGAGLRLLVPRTGR